MSYWASEQMFESAAPIYREALAKSGFDFELKYDPEACNPQKKKSRKLETQLPSVVVVRQLGHRTTLVNLPF